MTLRIFIPGVPKNSNASHQWAKFAAAADRKKFRKAAANIVEDDVAENGGFSVPVRIYAYHQARTKRRRDPTGLAERLKGILDGLVDAGLLFDDDEDHVEIVLSKAIVEKKAEPGIYLQIEPLELAIMQEMDI